MSLAISEGSQIVGGDIDLAQLAVPHFADSVLYGADSFDAATQDLASAASENLGDGYFVGVPIAETDGTRVFFFKIGDSGDGMNTLAENANTVVTGLTGGGQPAGPVILTHNGGDFHASGTANFPTIPGSFTGLQSSPND